MKKRMRAGLMKIMEKGQSAEAAAKQRELDDIFDEEKLDFEPEGHESSSQYDSDGEKVEKRKKLDADAVEDEGFAAYRKNNVEEDAQIAEAVIQGMAEYTEFKVVIHQKESKRVMQKQLVTNSHMVRLCLMRCFHPERLLDEIRSFVGFFLGVQYTEAPPFDFSNILSSASSKTPILFMNGPNVNCLNELHIFKKSAFTVNENITIQYQPLGSVAPEKVAKLIIKSACRGEWLLLDNL